METVIIVCPWIESRFVTSTDSIQRDRKAVVTEKYQPNSWAAATQQTVIEYSWQIELWTASKRGTTTLYSSP